MVVILSMAIVTGDKGTRLTVTNGIAYVLICAVVTGCAGEAAVVDMLNHNIRIVAFGAAGRRHSSIIMCCFMVGITSMTLSAVGLGSMAYCAVLVSLDSVRVMGYLSWLKRRMTLVTLIVWCRDSWMTWNMAC